jgi:hypothetical protein
MCRAGNKQTAWATANFETGLVRTGNVCKKPCDPNAKTLHVESNQKPQKAQRDDFHHQEADAALHPVITLERKHRGDDDDPRNQQAVFVVRSPKAH